MATSCNKFCMSDLCKRRKACACQCTAWFGGTLPALEKACIAACWGNSEMKDKQIFMCEELGAQEMLNQHGYICKGFDPLIATAQGQAYVRQQENLEKNSGKIWVWITILALAFVLLLVFYFVK